MKKTIIFAASLLALVACNKEVIGTQNVSEVGYLSFDATVEAGVKVETKAVSESELNAYKVTLSPGWTKTYGEIQGEVFTLATGSYTVDAENITPIQAETGKGNLRIAAPQQTIEVTANATATANLDCVPQSAAIILDYTDGFKGVFSDYSFVLTKQDGTKRQDGAVSLSLSEGDTAYYNAESGSVVLVYTITGTHNSTGAKTYSGQITLKRAYSTTVNVDQNSVSGGLKIVLTATNELTGETQTISVDPYQNN